MLTTNTDGAANIIGVSTEGISSDDFTWIMSNAFLILTMQTGFGMLEAGTVSYKNVVNIMVKNVIDVTFGGFAYWSFGYALTFGRPSNWFCGFGNFLFSPSFSDDNVGTIYAHYVFQFTFASSATTIVSGAIAERMKLTGYIVFSCLNIFAYVFPASWIWNQTGFLYTLRFFDFAGVTAIHCTGGVSALVATMKLGPRKDRFDENKPNNGEVCRLSSPITALTGTFMLWWAWLAFNCGATFGIERGLWKLAAKVAVVTLNGSIGGGVVGIFISYMRHRFFDISIIITSVLSGLVSITGAAAIIESWEALIVGAIGSSLAVFGTLLLEKLHIDDPVSAVPVHFVASTWGTIAVGLFGHNTPLNTTRGMNGLFYGGGFNFLWRQTLGWVVITAWSASVTWSIFEVLKRLNICRLDEREELLGADWVEHRIRTETFAVKLEQQFQALNLSETQMEELLMRIIHEVEVKKTSFNKSDTENDKPPQPTPAVDLCVACQRHGTSSGKDSNFHRVDAIGQHSDTNCRSSASTRLLMSFSRKSHNSNSSLQACWYDAAQKYTKSPTVSSATQPRQSHTRRRGQKSSQEAYGYRRHVDEAATLEYSTVDILSR